MTADALAKSNIENEFGIITFGSPPTHAIYASLADIDEIARSWKVGAGQFG